MDIIISYLVGLTHQKITIHHLWILILFLQLLLGLKDFGNIQSIDLLHKH
jgi:hypothetical protein